VAGLGLNLKGKIMLDIKDVAERCKVSEDTIRKFIDEGKFATPEVYEGNYFWDEDGLTAWMKKNNELLEGMVLYEQHNELFMTELNADDKEWTNELTPEKLKELDAKNELAGLRWFYKKICKMFSQPEQTNFGDVIADIKFRMEYLFIANNSQVKFLTKTCTETEKRRSIAYYVEHKSLIEIAADENKSVSSVAESVKTGMKKMRKEAEILKLFEK